jgi:hypothetical protein
VGAAAILSGSRVGVSRLAMARPHEEQKRTFSEDTAPQPEQVTIPADCTPVRSAPVKPHIRRTQQMTLGNSEVFEGSEGSLGELSATQK